MKKFFESDAFLRLASLCMAVLIWFVIGMAVYYLYSRKRSHLANGTEHE